MQRVTIDLPERFNFSVELPVHITYINRADHVGNDSIVSILNEARLHFLQATLGETLSFRGMQWINADLAVIYQSEAFYGDLLSVQVAATGFGRYGCDIVYLITNQTTKKDVAIAKMAMLFYDYDNRCLIPAPEDFPTIFTKADTMAG